MSTVFDVTGINVDGGVGAVLTSGIDTITITDNMTIPNVTIDQPEAVQAITVEVPGIQGPPGLQNVFIQVNNPAEEFDWGPEDANKIWIQIT